MKKLTALFLSILMVVTMTACGEKETKSRLEQIKEKGVITVATEPYFAPNEFIDPSKEGIRQYVGADIELANYIAEKLGVKCEIVPLEFTAVLSSVAEGKYDLAISALAYKPDRAEAMNMSKGYYFDEDTEGYGMMCNTADVGKYTDAASMKDAVIVVQQGSLQQDYVTTQIPEYKELKFVSSMTDAFLMVKEGKADLAACFIGNGRLYSEANPDVSIVEGFKFEENKDWAGTRIGMLKGEDELTEEINKIIDEVIESGIFAQWYEEYSDYAASLGL